MREDLVEKYRERLVNELQLPKLRYVPSFSKEYKEFRKEILPKRISLYEKFCKISENFLKIKPGKEKGKRLKDAIDTCHLNITPSGVVSFSILAPLVIIFIGSIFSYLIFQSSFFLIFFLLMGLAMITPLSKLPEFIATKWRLKASNQMVLCIFYVVTYMRHTSNLENAIRFASDHLAPPLALDLKKIVWNLETSKYSSIKESLDTYLETWRNYNLEFIEAFHLVEGSLYEGAESNRLTTLDKSLDVILEETYEKMLHYAQDLKSPMTMLHMLGVILPILGLVILPLVVSFMEGIEWYHIALIYNVALPIGVYYLGKTILSKRPTGYGESDISEDNPELKKYRNVILNIGEMEIKINPLFIALIVGFVLLMIGLSPILIHLINPDFVDIGVGSGDDTTACKKQFCFLDYHEVDGESKGPYGLGATLLGLFIPLAFGIAIGTYYSLRSKNVIKIREDTKKLEDEFASGLFQLGNRLGDNLPAEIAFGRVAKIMRGTASGKFFNIVNNNITRLGMSVKEAIFNPKIGAMVYFPSRIIESSMKVLIESIKKGPKIAARALVNISRYIKEIHRVNERLKDLMADIISGMKSQIKFLAPAIAGIVVGITSMVTTILGKLSSQMQQITEGTGTADAPISVIQLFGEGIAAYYFQIIVGIYIVQIVYILTILTNSIENGEDKLNERFTLGKNMKRSILLYSLISMTIIVAFNYIAATILTSRLI